MRKRPANPHDRSGRSAMLKRRGSISAMEKKRKNVAIRTRNSFLHTISVRDPVLFLKKTKKRSRMMILTVGPT